jgi:hypothetical protein
VLIHRFVMDGMALRQVIFRVFLFSLVSIIPILDQIDLYLFVAVIRKTNRQSLSVFQKQYFFCIIRGAFDKTILPINFTIVWPCIVTDSLWIKPTDALNSNFISFTTLHVSGSLSANLQEFLAVYQLWYILGSCDEPFATKSRMRVTSYFW